MSAIINMTMDEINDRWKEEGIGSDCVDRFNKWHNARIAKFMNTLKEICYNGDSVENKKKLILEKIMVTLYQTVIDIQKGDAKSLENKC